MKNLCYILFATLFYCVNIHAQSELEPPSYVELSSTILNEETQNGAEDEIAEIDPFDLSSIAFNEVTTLSIRIEDTINTKAIVYKVFENANTIDSNSILINSENLLDKIYTEDSSQYIISFATDFEISDAIEIEVCFLDQLDQLTTYYSVNK